MDTGDEELIRRCVSGDQAAWSEFVRRYIRLVAYVVRKTLSRASEEDVDDVIEEYFAHLVDQQYRVLRNLREPYHLKAWLAVGARRKALDHAKKRAPPTTSLDVSPLEKLAGAAIDPSTDDAEEVRRAVEEAGLNPKERLMISLFYFKEQSYAEIARITGVPENSIGPTVRRALDKIKEALQKRGWVR